MTKTEKKQLVWHLLQIHATGNAKVIFRGVELEGDRLSGFINGLELGIDFVPETNRPSAEDFEIVWLDGQAPKVDDEEASKTDDKDDAKGKAKGKPKGRKNSTEATA